MVTNFAEAAGFRGDDLARAVAVAMVTSQGDDQWREAPSVGLSGGRWGLWGVPGHVVVESQRAALLAPSVNASWAHALWLAAEGSWEWLPERTRQLAERELPYVAQAMRTPKRPQTAPTLGPADLPTGPARRLISIAKTVIDRLAGAERAIRSRHGRIG